MKWMLWMLMGIKRNCSQLTFLIVVNKIILTDFVFTLCLERPQKTNRLRHTHRWAFIYINSMSCHCNQRWRMYDVVCYVQVLVCWLPLYGMMAALIARFTGPTWVPSGADRTQEGPMLAPGTLLSGCLPRYPRWFWMKWIGPHLVYIRGICYQCCNPQMNIRSVIRHPTIQSVYVSSIGWYKTV